MVSWAHVNCELPRLLILSVCNVELFVQLLQVILRTALARYPWLSASGIVPNGSYRSATTIRRLNIFILSIYLPNIHLWTFFISPYVLSCLWCCNKHFLSLKRLLSLLSWCICPIIPSTYWDRRLLFLRGHQWAQELLLLRLLLYLLYALLLSLAHLGVHLS